MAASLEPYLRKAVKADNTTKIFNEVPGGMPPMLSKARTNRILVYNGCFNPPHQGHLALLNHTFHNCGEDLNVVAAVVIVASDQYLQFKFGHHGGVLMLPLEWRMRLWAAELEARRVNWCFVYPEEEWSDASAALRRDLRRDGFGVERVRVAGGDKIGRAFHTHGVWGCQKMITSDVCRPVDFYQGSAPVTLNKHAPWNAVGVDDDALRERARLKVLYSSAADGKTEGSAGPGLGRPDDPRAIVLEDRINDVYLESVADARKRKVWVCDCTSNRRGYTARFVASDDHLDPDISSERIRAIIANSSPDRLEAELQGIAMSPALLTQLILELSTS